MVISRETFNVNDHYRRIRFHEDRQLLDSELNELQEMQAHARAKLAAQVFTPGAIVSGCEAAVTGPQANEVQITAGEIFINDSIEPVAAVQLTYDPEKTQGEDFVYAQLLRRTIDLSLDERLLNPRTLEPTAERERWEVTLVAQDSTTDPLLVGVVGRVVEAVFVFDRALGTVRPVAPRSSLSLANMADAAIEAPGDGQILRYDEPAGRWRNTGLPRLGELSDVSAGAPQEGQLLRFDAVAQTWKNSNENTNADTVDGFHACAFAEPNKLLPLDSAAKISGALINGTVANAQNAETVDSLHASATASANKLLALDATGALNMGGYPVRNVQLLQTGTATMAPYNRFGLNYSSHSLSSPYDVLVSGRLEVDAAAYFDNAVSVNTNLSVGGALGGCRCMLLCGHVESNVLRGDAGYYCNLKSPLGIYHATAHGMYMPRAGSVTGLLGRFDLLASNTDSNLTLEIISYPSWRVESIDLPDTTVKNDIVIGPHLWVRNDISFEAGDHVWLRLHQAGPATSRGEVANVEVMVEVTLN